MSDISERLNRIQRIIENDPFKGNRALNNGNGGYIFDYDPQDELIVRNHVRHLTEIPGLGFEVLAIDLFDDILIPFLEEEGFLEEVSRIEEECRESGSPEELIRATRDLLQQGYDGDIFLEYLEKHVKPNSVILILGVGKCHPFIRSHQIINSFDSLKHGVKTILFYPGSYDQKELRLFGTIPSENYYRASILVPR